MHLLLATDSCHYTQEQNSVTGIRDTSNKTRLKLKKRFSRNEHYDLSQSGNDSVSSYGFLHWKKRW